MRKREHKEGERERETHRRIGEPERYQNIDGGEEIQIKPIFCNFDGLHSPPYREKQ